MIVQWRGDSDVSAIIEAGGVVYMDRALSDEALGAARGIYRELERLERILAPDYEVTEPRRGGLRPMITGPEPMHVDTWNDGGRLALTAFVCFDDVRVWDVGPNLVELCRAVPDAMRAVWARGRPGFATRLRALTMRNAGPLPDDGPAHRCEFGEGAVWFCNSKIVPHAIRHGGGAVGETVFAENRRGQHSQAGLLEACLA